MRITTKEDASATPAASLQHSDKPTLEGLDSHRIRQAALVSQPIIQEEDSLVKLLRRQILLSALLSQLNLLLAPVMLAVVFSTRNPGLAAVSLDKATLPRRLSKVVEFSVLQEGRLVASAQETVLGPDLVLGAVYLAAITNSSSNSRSRSHLVRQLALPGEVLELVLQGLATITILRTPAVVSLAILVRPTQRLGSHSSSSQLSKTHSVALGLKIKTSPTLHRPSEPLVISSNKSKSLADSSATQLQIIKGVPVYLGT